VFVGFSLELLQTTQVDDEFPSPLQFPICYPRKRLDYIALEQAGITPGGAPTHASFIAYLWPQGALALSDAACDRFAETFSKFGRVVVPA
jgi:hypothetical protein